MVDEALGLALADMDVELTDENIAMDDFEIEPEVTDAVIEDAAENTDSEEHCLDAEVALSQAAMTQVIVQAKIKIFLQ